MGKTLYIKCKEIFDMLPEVRRINLEQLKSLIMRFIGSDKRTISNALSTMLSCKLIKDKGHFFEICQASNISREETKSTQSASD